MKNFLLATLIFIVLTAPGCTQASVSTETGVAGVEQPVISLNGTWKFSMDPPENYWENHVDFSDWPDILVPGECQMQGFAIQHDLP